MAFIVSFFHAEHAIRFPFLGKQSDETVNVVEASDLHRMASQYLSEDPTGFRKEAKRAYRLTLLSELSQSLDLHEDRQAGRGLSRISVEVTRSRSQAKSSGQLISSLDGLFNDHSEGIDLDSVMVSLIGENNSELISTALHLMQRNRRLNTVGRDQSSCFHNLSRAHFSVLTVI